MRLIKMQKRRLKTVLSKLKCTWKAEVLFLQPRDYHMRDDVNKTYSISGKAEGKWSEHFKTYLPSPTLKVDKKLMLNVPHQNKRKAMLREKKSSSEISTLQSLLEPSFVIIFCTFTQIHSSKLLDQDRKTCWRDYLRKWRQMFKINFCIKATPSSKIVAWNDKLPYYTQYDFLNGLRYSWRFHFKAAMQRHFMLRTRKKRIHEMPTFLHIAWELGSERNFQHKYIR